MSDVPPALRALLHDHTTGRRARHDLRPGLQLLVEDAHAPCSFTAQAVVNPGLRLVVLLEGALDVSYGPERMALPQGPAGASAVLVALTEPECFTRRLHQGVYARRVTLGLDDDWLAQAGGGAATPELARFMRQHLSTRRWQLSPRMATVAEQIVRPPPLAPLLQHMYLESRVLDLMGEALGALCRHAPESHGEMALRPREHQRLRELHAFLASGQADGMSLDEIARHAGLNPNSLQRQFRTIYGVTIFDHLRECRLQRARQLLERDGVTVAQAALAAGYASAANFATAYKQRFGTPPKLARARV
ncbi:MAG: AraC family transcriptional regulator [Acidovorax sp.]